MNKAVKTKKVRKLHITPEGLSTEHGAAIFVVDDKKGGLLKTKTGTYGLKKHPVHNFYLGIARGRKVHVSIKSQILIFWD